MREKERERSETAFLCGGCVTQYHHPMGLGAVLLNKARATVQARPLPFTTHKAFYKPTQGSVLRLGVTQGSAQMETKRPLLHISQE